MKKFSKAFLALAISLLVMTGCHKETKNPQSEQESSKKFKSLTTPTFTFYNYGVDITEADFLANKTDALDEKFNYINHAMTLGIIELYNYPSVMNDLIQTISQTANKQCDLMAFASNHPDVDVIMNAIFNNRFRDFSSFGSNWKTYVEENYKYDRNYIPLVKFINGRSVTVDLQKNVYISEPYEIDEDKFPSFDDNLPLWMKVSGILKFSTIDQGQSYNVDNPIIAVTNGFSGDDNRQMELAPGPFDPGGRAIDRIPGTPNPKPISCNVSWHSHEWLTHTKFKIDQRFENMGRSEYNFVWGVVKGYDANTGTYVPYGLNTHTSYSQEKKVKKDEVGTTIDFWFDVFGQECYPSMNLCFDAANMPTSEYQRFAVNAYENDWGNSAKELYHVSAAWGTLYGTRKYYDEVYLFWPEYNASYPFNVRNPTINSTFVQAYNGTAWLLRRH